MPSCRVNGAVAYCGIQARRDEFVRLGPLQWYKSLRIAMQSPAFTSKMVVLRAFEGGKGISPGLLTRSAPLYLRRNASVLFVVLRRDRQANALEDIIQRKPHGDVGGFLRSNALVVAVPEKGRLFSLGWLYDVLLLTKISARTKQTVHRTDEFTFRAQQNLTHRQ